MGLLTRHALPIIGSLAVLCGAQQLSSVPNVSDYYRRWAPKATIIGDYLYIDSGEISQDQGDGRPWRFSNPVNETLSINMAESWDPQTVEIRQIEKEPISMMRGSLIPDESSQTFYVWGGAASYEGRIPQADLWKFEADGEGGGTWRSELPENSGTFTELARSSGNSVATVPGAAFIFGGSASAVTETNSRRRGPIPGFLEFNFTSQTWTNHTDSPGEVSSAVRGGAAVHVPTFGPNGLIMLLGGRDMLGREEGGTFVSMQNVTFMDPVTREWYTQTATGEAPGPRQWHCAVGVESRNQTFEIFVYGGAHEVDEVGFDDVHILSVPGFVWRRAQYPSRSPRDNHACVVAGKRQLISIGGLASQMEVADRWTDKDPKPQGLGIFDLTDLEWKETYDADASDYQTPDIIQSWYDDGGLDNVAWSSDEVSALFTTENNDDEESSPSPAPGGDGSGDADEDGSDEGSSTPVGAIAGGVVGGVAGIALIGALVWFLLRRRRRREAIYSAGTKVGPATPTGTAAVTTTTPDTEYSAKKEAPAELHGQPTHRHEAPWHVYEMPSNSPPAEMCAWRQQ